MKKIYKTKYLTVFALVSLVFLLGIFFGQAITKAKMSDFARAQNEFRRYLLSLELQTELASKHICNIDVFELTKEKTELGQKIEFLEKRLGKTNKEILGLKEDYSLLSIRQWLLLEKVRKECGGKFVIILYFYSNEKNTSVCEAQGYILDYLYRKYPENVVIYAFDTDLDNPALNTLKIIYQIEEVPSLVIDEKLYPGLQKKDKLESIILEKLQSSPE